MRFNPKYLSAIPVVIFALFFGCIFISIFSDFLFHFDFSPAKGTAVGYISYQEKSGFYQLDQACWRDTAYSPCEFFDPNGQKFEPGQYKIDYECTTFVWAWQKPSTCTIVSATRTGDIPLR